MYFCIFKKIESLSRYLYINGPTWLGSWEGQSLHDICSSITHVDSKHFAVVPQACIDLINRKVKAGLIGATVVVASITFWSLMQTCMNYSAYMILKRK